MRSRCPMLAFTALTLITPVASVAQEATLAGVWEVTEWSDWTAGGQATHSYGEDPAGMFVYTPGGHVILYTSPAPGFPKPPPANQPDTVAITAYYGTYTVDAQTSTVTHRVQGGNAAQRQFRFEGDDLVIYWTDPAGGRHLRRLRRVESL